MSTTVPTNPSTTPRLEYHLTPFSQGKMLFAWEEWTPERSAQAYADWQMGRGLIGGDPQRRPDSHLLPHWGIDRPFFRALALDDQRGKNGTRLRNALASDCPVEIEIGFGRGDFLLDRALRYPDRCLIGYETKTKATRLCLARIDKLALSNLWLSDDDCRFNLPRIVPDGRVDMIHILFPDPWWKAQHQVKRLFSPPFVDLLAAKLRSGGLLFFKSDVQAYGEMVCSLVETHGAFLPHNPEEASRIGEFAPTHREFWCLQNQRPIWSYYFTRR